jgi:cbb3-type cytochrome oxidase cytochrome c subunit
MPATEETYRRQTTLHVVFAVSSIVMLLTTVWMIMADHLRPWKSVQREFHRVETDKLEAAEQKKNEETQARHSTDLEKLDEEIKRAEQLAYENRDKIHEVENQIKKVLGEFESLDTRTRFKKAELDSKRSEYDLIIDKGDPVAANKYLNAVIVPTENDYHDLEKKLEVVVDRQDTLKAELAVLKGGIDDLVSRRDEINRDVDRIKRALTQKKALYGLGGLISGWKADFRELPVVDLAAPPVKIQQISLPDLTINYNFKDVPRYDRCQTCHLGIDKLGYDKDAHGKPMKDTHPAFASHPFLTDGATALDPKGNVVTAGLYLDGNGPHKINSFGCTICHGGQGSGTSFTYASHTPNDLHQREEWAAKNNWEHIHFWDEPMRPKRFIESSCLKCHHQVTDVPQAKKLQAGYERITKYGCTGCHTIGGEGSFGPDLTDNRQVGPNLAHLGTKVTKDWATRWIRNPHEFRPDTRMPRFYDVTNNVSKGDPPKVQAEVHAMAHYLFAVSTPTKGFSKPAKAGDAAKGKSLFFEKGCMACHSHKEFPPESFPKSVQQYATASFGPDLSNIAIKFADTDTGRAWLANWIKEPEAYHPKSLMPNLQLSLDETSDIAAWLMSVKPTLRTAWVDPNFVQPVESDTVNEGLDELVKLYITKAKAYKSKPVLLSEVDSTVASLSRDDKLMYLGEKTISRLGCFGCHNIPGFEDAKPIGTALNGWGIKGAAKLDFGHIVEYLDNRRQKDDHGHVGYDGTDEYYKEQIDEHNREGFLYQKLHRPRSFDFEKTKDDIKAWDDRLRMPQFSFADDPQAVEEVMTFVLGLTGEKIAGKYLPRYTPAKAAIAQGERLLERYNCKGCHVLQMPKYTIAAGTKITDALVDLRTNIEGSYGRRNDDYLSFYQHLPGYTYDPNVKSAALEESLKGETSGFVLTDSTGKAKGHAAKAYVSKLKGGKSALVDDIGRELKDPTKKYYINDHGKSSIVDFKLNDLDPKGELFLIDKDNTPVDRKTTLIIPNDPTTEAITFEAMPTDQIEDESEPGKIERKLSISLWRPATVRGYTFNVRDNLTLNPDKVSVTEAEGGRFPWLYARTQADKQGTDYATFWNRLPPPLLREGKKVQTPWLTAFLKDPYPIRPAANLRMPKFHLGNVVEPVSGGAKPLSSEQFDSQKKRAHEAVQKEASELANYFAAVDGAEFPYQSIPERDRDYLASAEAKHADYLGGGWTIITKGLCVGCHTIGQFKAAGGENVVNGPDLRQVGARFQSGYLTEWLAQPARLVPFTAMPQNVPPHLPPGTPEPTNVPKSFQGDQFAQVHAMRDVLMNYVSAVEQQLATAKPAEPAKPPEEKKPAAGGD